MDTVAGGGLPVQSADQLFRNACRYRRRRAARLRADFAAPGRPRPVVDRRPVLPQRALAGAAVLRDVPAAVRVSRRRDDDSFPGLDQGDAGARAAHHGERRRDPPRRRTVDPHRAVGCRTLARVLAPADPVEDHPAAVREADAAAVDELVRDPDHGDDAGVSRRRERGHDAYPADHQRGGPHRPADPDLQLWLLWFFLYCWPISLMTRWLEARYE